MRLYNIYISQNFFFTVLYSHKTNSLDKINCETLELVLLH